METNMESKSPRNVKNVIGLFDPFSCCYGLRHFDVKLRPYIVISHIYESRSSIAIIYSFFLITLLGNKNYISLLRDSCKQMYLEPGRFASCKFDPCADVSTGVGSHNIYIPYGACSRGLTTGISCTISRINTWSSDKFMQCYCVRFIETGTIQTTYSKNPSLEN